MPQTAAAMTNVEPLIIATLQQLLLLAQSPGRAPPRRAAAVMKRCLDALVDHEGLSAGNRRVVQALAEAWARRQLSLQHCGAAATRPDAAGCR